MMIATKIIWETWNLLIVELKEKKGLSHLFNFYYFVIDILNYL